MIFAWSVDAQSTRARQLGKAVKLQGVGVVASQTLLSREMSNLCLVVNIFFSVVHLLNMITELLL